MLFEKRVIARCHVVADPEPWQHLLHRGVHPKPWDEEQGRAERLPRAPPRACSSIRALGFHSLGHFCRAIVR